MKKVIKKLKDQGTIYSFGPKLLVLFILLYVCISGIIIFAGITNFNLGTKDIAIYQTALWQAGQLMTPINYFSDWIPNIEIFNQLHFMPVGFIYGLFYRIFSPMITTGLLYIIVFSLSTILIYIIVNSIMNNNIYSSMFAILHNLYFFLPQSHFYPLDDFAVLFIAGGIYYFLTNKLNLATLFFVIALMHKEYYGLAISSFSLGQLIKLFIYSNRRKKIIQLDQSETSVFLLLWLIGGTLWFAISFFIIMPISGVGWINNGMFKEVGGIIGSLENFSNSINIIFDRFIHPINIQFIFNLLIPFCFFSIIGFEYLFAVIPILLIIIATDDFHASKIAVNHYTIWFSPFITTSAALGFKRLLKYFNSNYNLKILIVFCISTSFIYFSSSRIRLQGYYLKGRILENKVFYYYRNDIKNIIKQIPSNSSIATNDRLLPYLSNRKYLYTLSNIEASNPDFVLRDYFQKEKTKLYDDIYGNDFIQTYSIPPQEFYNSKDWDNVKIDNEYSAEYELHIRSGAIVLYKRKAKLLKYSQI